MNKLYIATAITLATVSFASAQGGYNMMRGNGEAPRVQAQAQVRQNEGDNNQGYMMNDVQRMMTGSSTVSLQVQALNKEMEDKIKAIRDDYMARIRAIIGNTTRPATTTPPGMMEGEKRGIDEGRKMGRPFTASSTTGTGTSESNRPLPPQGLFEFFRPMFGGNR